VPARFSSAQLGAGGLHSTLLEFADTLQDHIAGGTGLALIGATGTGKTYAIAAMLLLLADRHADHIAQDCGDPSADRDVNAGRAERHGFHYANAEYVGLALRNTFTKSSAETELDVLRVYTTPRLLALDEVGAASDEHARKAIATILCLRYEQAMPTILAGNLTRSELEQYLGARAADRLAESCKFIATTGPSKRRVPALSTVKNSAGGAQ
jgi:DNA replication protein DnaC